MIGGKPGFHKHKVEGKILNDLNSFLRFAVNDPRLQFVSITRVDLQGDYSRAKVYWDTFDCGKRNQAQAAMQGVTGKLRGLLAQALKMKSVPELLIQYDDQFADEERIKELLKH